MNLHRTARAVASAAIAVSSLAVISAVTGLGAAPASASTSCAASALPKKGTTDITFWEEMSAGNETEIQKLVADFNKSQHQIHVTDLNQSGGYQVAFQDYVNSLGTSTEPNVLMLDQYATQGAVDSKSITPVATCIAGTGYSTKPYAPKSILEETVNGALQGLPYSVSAPILIYNQNAFTKAGIKTPPTTLAEMAADAAALKAAGYVDGMSLKLDPWYLQVLQGVGNSDFVNNNNGRTGRATAAAFDNSAGLATFTELQDIVKSGDAVTNPSTGGLTTQYANLFAIGYNKSGMTIDSSATLGTVIGLLKDYKTVKLGVAPLPDVSSSVAGGVEPGGNALFIPTYPNTSAAKLAASWEFIQWLTSATEMATWDAHSGYVPIRSDAAKTSIMKSYWKKYPQLKVAYTEVSTGPVNDATAGPLLGDYYQINTDLTTYEDTLLTSPYPSPSSVLSQASTQVTNDIQSYNSSL